MTDDRVTPAKLRTALSGLEKALRSRTCPTCGRMNTEWVEPGLRWCRPCNRHYDSKPKRER